MSVYLPTLKQLQYLVALHDAGHFGRAAEASFVTQSTLSAGIRELETLIGVVLVERTRRVVRFTPLGESIVAKARRVLREAEELTDMGPRRRPPAVGRNADERHPDHRPVPVAAPAPRLRRDYPELKLFLREEPSAAACEGLHHGRTDCVLLALPYGCGEVEVAPLFEDRLLLLAVPGNDSGDTAPLVADDIDPERLLLLEDGHCLKDHALRACEQPESRGQAMMMGTSLHTIVQMIDNGLGTTMLPQMAIDAGILEHTGVTARPIESKNAQRRIALVWRRASPRERDFRLLADVLTRRARLIQISPGEPFLRLNRISGVGARRTAHQFTATTGENR